MGGLVSVCQASCGLLALVGEAGREPASAASIEGDDTVPQDEDRPAAEADVPVVHADAAAEAEASRGRRTTGDGTDRSSLSQLRKQGRRQEDTDLSALVKNWVEDTWHEDHVKLTFIETELEARLRSWRKQARWWRAAQLSIWLLIALLGLLISVFAGFKSGHGFTIIAGALVATLTTLTNATHPAKQADGYLNARLTLRDEGWDLLNGTGSYAKLENDEARYKHFVATVHDVVQTKRKATNLDALTA